jgi:hypothetical protein
VRTAATMSAIAEDGIFAPNVMLCSALY